jgi:hypothetical protein
VSASAAAAALPQLEPRPAYRPVVDLGSGSVIAYEAVARASDGELARARRPMYTDRDYGEPPTSPSLGSFGPFSGDRDDPEV